jgi:pimeloyl-ACP methyl ester carboxylesterase
MSAPWPAFLVRLRPRSYGRKTPLVLINGLAEQAESWYRNHWYWRRYFDVFMPNLLVYDGPILHNRIEQGLPITVDYLVEQLHDYLTRYVQVGPYHLVASSLGGKIAVEYAVRFPEQVNRIVLLCPSGMGDKERLPLVEGVRRNDMKALVESVFYNPRKHTDGEVVRFYKRAFPNRRWRSGLVRTARGTMDHSVRPLLSRLRQPTLLVSGKDDKIVDPVTAAQAAKDLPNGQFLLLPRCGHAPQIEKSRLINRLVVHFLTHPRPSIRPRLSQLLLGSPR